MPRGPPPPPAPPLMRWLLALLLLLYAEAQTVDSALEVPYNLKIEADDRRATLWWGPPPTRSSTVFVPLSPGIEGYWVFWKKQSDPWSAATLFATLWTAAQLTPLEPGVIYEARVQTVGTRALTVSAFSSVVAFASNSSRVDALRSTICTGFFDDFNQPAGPLNPLKWHTAVGGCSDTSVGKSFVSDKFSAVTMQARGPLFCDRSSTMSRPRVPFDFSGRTGNIFVDWTSIASGYGRHWIEIVPFLVDEVARYDVFAFDPTPGLAPINSIRISFYGGPQIHYVGADGVQNDITTQTAEYDWDGNYNFLFPGILAPIHILLSTTSIELRIREITYATATFSPPLPFTKAYVMMNTKAADLSKSDSNPALESMPWDNFGFDGPAPAVNTVDYPSVNHATYLTNATNVLFDTVNIPDDFSAATAIRLMFTRACTRYPGPNASPSDFVQVNSQSFPIPTPDAMAMTGFGAVSNVLSDDSPVTSVIDIPPSALIRGSNAVLLSILQCGIAGFVHIEMDIPKSINYNYTEPPLEYTLFSEGFPIDVYYQWSWAGPFTSMDWLDTTHVSAIFYYDGFSTRPDYAVVNVTASANTLLNFTAAVDRDIEQRLTPRGLGYIELIIDQQLVSRADMRRAPQFTGFFSIDTRGLSNGLHEFWVRPFSIEGIVGSTGNNYQLNLNDSFARYKPVVVNITGGGQAFALTAQPSDPIPSLLPPPPTPTYTPKNISLGPAAATTAPPTSTAPVIVTSPTPSTCIPDCTCTGLPPLGASKCSNGVWIISSNVNVTGPVKIDLGNGTLLIEGNLTLSSKVNITVNQGGRIITQGCAEIDGSITIILSNGTNITNGTSIPVVFSNSSCASLALNASKPILQGGTSRTCSITTAEWERSSATTLSVLLTVESTCGKKKRIHWWGYLLIAIGCVMIGGGVFAAIYYRSRHSTMERRRMGTQLRSLTQM